MVVSNMVQEMFSEGFIGDKVVTLEEGDSIYFDSIIPHRRENVGEVDVEAIWAITPPSF